MAERLSQQELPELIEILRNFGFWKSLYGDICPQRYDMTFKRPSKNKRWYRCGGLHQGHFLIMTRVCSICIVSSWNVMDISYAPSTLRSRYLLCDLWQNVGINSKICVTYIGSYSFQSAERPNSSPLYSIPIQATSLFNSVQFNLWF